MKFTQVIYIICLSSIMIASCDEDDKPAGKGSLVIEFDSRVGDDDLVLDTEYANASGENFTLTKFNYYISNIRLTRTNGSEYVVPQDQSYFLIIEDDDESHEIELSGIPAGDYNKVTFTIGVDSLRSTMDVSKRTGVLDPAQGHDGMYWVWNSGYIFFKMEGTSPSAPEDQENKFYYHIGGYGGYDAPTLNNIRETTVSMGDARALVRPNKRPEVHLHVDVLEVFKNPTTIKIEEHSLVMFSEYSKTVSGNYVNMFKYDHVHN